MWEQVRSLLGIGSDTGDIGPLATALRTIIVYALTLAILFGLGRRRLSTLSSVIALVAPSLLVALLGSTSVERL